MALSSGLMPLWSTCSIIAPFSTKYCTWEKKGDMSFNMALGSKGRPMKYLRYYVIFLWNTLSICCRVQYSHLKPTKDPTAWAGWREAAVLSHNHDLQQWSCKGRGTNSPAYGQAPWPMGLLKDLFTLPVPAWPVAEHGPTEGTSLAREMGAGTTPGQWHTANVGTAGSLDTPHSPAVPSTQCHGQNLTQCLETTTAAMEPEGLFTISS